MTRPWSVPGNPGGNASIVPKYRLSSFKHPLSRFHASHFPYEHRGSAVSSRAQQEMAAAQSSPVHAVHLYEAIRARRLVTNLGASWGHAMSGEREGGKRRGYGNPPEGRGGVHLRQEPVPAR